jgi:hypothetical protein
MAMVLIGLVVTSLVVVTAAVAADVRRTRQLETDTQLRQLLLAGAADAAAHAKTWGDAPTARSWTLALPEALTERGYRVQLSVLEARGLATNAIEVRVEAYRLTTRKDNLLRFLRTDRTDGVWKLSDVGRGNAE